MVRRTDSMSNPYRSRTVTRRSYALIALVASISLVHAPAVHAQAAKSQKALVRQAVLDYVEGFYEGDSTRFVRSVSPDVFKFGYSIPRDSTAYRGSRMTWQQFHNYANRVKSQNQQAPKTAKKEIVVFDVLDQTASAKLTASWGVDYLLLARQDGQWKVTHVLWQTLPQKPQSSAGRGKKRAQP